MIKSIIWVAALLIVAYYVMGILGYEINKDYFSYSKKRCEEKLKECSEELVRKGTEGAQCNFDCVDPKLIIRKK